MRKLTTILILSLLVAPVLACHESIAVPEFPGIVPVVAVVGMLGVIVWLKQ